MTKTKELHRAAIRAADAVDRARQTKNPDRLRAAAANYHSKLFAYFAAHGR